MAKDNTENSNQLNLTVVALVALVAIVGLVALVMNAASLKTVQLATGSKAVEAQDAPTNRDTENIAGQAAGKKGNALKQIGEPAGDLWEKYTDIVGGDACGGGLAGNWTDHPPANDEKESQLMNLCHTQINCLHATESQSRAYNCALHLYDIAACEKKIGRCPNGLPPVLDDHNDCSCN